MQSRLSLRASSRSPMRRSMRQLSPSRSVNGSGVSTAPNLVTKNRFPEHPTAETKLRLVFNELDIEQTKKVTVHNFRQVLKALNISFSSETVEDLFARADLDMAGCINYTEFLNFAKNYPHLIETIYARSRQIVERAIRDGQLQQQCEKQEEMQRNERLLQQQWDVAKDELAAQQAGFEAMEESVKVSSQNLKDKTKELVNQQQDLDRSKAERSVKERDLTDTRDVERAALKPLRDMERNIDLSQERLTKMEAQLDTSREKERQLEAMLESAKRDMQLQVEAVTGINGNLTEMRERAAELAVLHEDAQGEASRTEREFQDAEEEVRSIRQNVEVMDRVKGDAQIELKEMVSSLEFKRNDLIPFRQRESNQRAKHEDARKVFDDAERTFVEMERDLEAFDAGRADAENAEQRVLVNEVQLREQRRNLNSKDDELWTEGGHLMQQTQRDDSRLQIAQGNTRGF